jgi:hypothetical protein
MSSIASSAISWIIEMGVSHLTAEAAFIDAPQGLRDAYVKGRSVLWLRGLLRQMMPLAHTRCRRSTPAGGGPRARKAIGRKMGLTTISVQRQLGGQPAGLWRPVRRYAASRGGVLAEGRLWQGTAEAGVAVDFDYPTLIGLSTT